MVEIWKKAKLANASNLFHAKSLNYVLNKIYEFMGRNGQKGLEHS